MILLAIDHALGSFRSNLHVAAKSTRHNRAECAERDRELEPVTIAAGPEFEERSTDHLRRHVALPFAASDRFRQQATSAQGVRRAKAALSSGCKSHPAKCSSRKQPEQSGR
jgi:hypothetical protein